MTTSTHNDYRALYMRVADELTDMLPELLVTLLDEQRAGFAIELRDERNDIVFVTSERDNNWSCNAFVATEQLARQHNRMPAGYFEHELSNTERMYCISFDETGPATGHSDVEIMSAAHYIAGFVRASRDELR